MTFLISQSVLAGAINENKLEAEIALSGYVSAFTGLIVHGDSLEILGQVTNLPGLNVLLAEHEPESLDEKKALKILAIDKKSKEIIEGGFTFDGHQFSMSTQAQTNWLGMHALQGVLTWPMGVTTHTNETYNMEAANLTPFILAGVAKVAYAVGSGRALKIACNAATTQAELDAVVDNR